MKKYLDKILHFVGCAIGVFVISRFMHINYAVFGTLLFAIGVEVGDFKNYGWAIIKSKDKKKIQEYLVNIIGDMIMGIIGVLVMTLMINLF